MATMTQDRMLNTEEVANRLGLSQESVLRRLRQGTLIGYNLEGTWRVMESDLKSYLDQRRNRPQNKK